METEEQKQEKEIYALIDYKGHFGSKTDSKFYRSGMDINLLIKHFKGRSYNLKVLKFNDVDFRNCDWKNKYVIYTSQEDPGYYYKNYIEDVIYSLELSGAFVIPKFKFLRANNNKIFMELLREIEGSSDMKKIHSYHFGSYEDFQNSNFQIERSLVFKSAEGAKSRGVFLVSSKKEALAIAKKVSKTPIFKDDLKDFIRPNIHKGYIKNSSHRKKFIVQNFIEGLKNDWKILIFGDKYFIEYRGARDNDFRASGSGKFLFDTDIQDLIPTGIFEFAEAIRNLFDTPHLSLDIGYINNEFYLFEYQALYFSSYASLMAKTYFVKKDGQFIRVEGELELEQLYANSVVDYIQGNYQG